MSAMFTITLLVIAGGAACLIGDALLHRRLFAKYWSRGCLGAEWKRQFPEAKKTEIRDFLAIFTSSFGLPDKSGLNFNPGDKVMDIYKTIYPPNTTFADGLECETLHKCIKETYKVDVLSIWNKELTLGKLFRFTRGR